LKTFKVAFIKKAYEENLLKLKENQDNENLKIEDLIFNDFAIQFFNQFRDHLNFNTFERLQNVKDKNSQILFCCSIDVPQSARKKKPKVIINRDTNIEKDKMIIPEYKYEKEVK